MRLDFEYDFKNKLEELQGFFECWEHAVYDAHVSEKLRDVAIETAIMWTGDDAASRWQLVQRPKPESRLVSKGESQRNEWDLVTDVTCVVLLDDEEVDTNLIKEAMPYTQVQYKYTYCDMSCYGAIHFGWAVCIIQPRPMAAAKEEKENIERTLGLLQNVIVLRETRRTFDRLLVHEVRQQAEMFIGNGSRNRFDRHGNRRRGARDLNGLKIIAQAVLEMTRYESVSEVDEIQPFFQEFEKYARLATFGQRITSRCQILHDVQEAETSSDEKQRSKFLNLAVLILSGLTCLSVAGDMYNFARYDVNWLPTLIFRLSILGCFASVLFILLTALWYWANRK